MWGPKCMPCVGVGVNKLGATIGLGIGNKTANGMLAVFIWFARHGHNLIPCFRHFLEFKNDL